MVPHVVKPGNKWQSQIKASSTDSESDENVIPTFFFI
jgi:hypothetical protein